MNGKNHSFKKNTVSLSFCIDIISGRCILVTSPEGSFCLFIFLSLCLFVFLVVYSGGVFFVVYFGGVFLVYFGGVFFVVHDLSVSVDFHSQTKGSPFPQNTQGL